MKFTPLVVYLIDQFFIVLWLSVHLFGGISVCPDAPGGDLRYQPASVPIQQHPQLRWRHWRRGMRHAVSPSQHPPGSGFPTCTGKARRRSSWHQVSPTRTASTAMLTSAAASHVVAPRVLVSLPTLALGPGGYSVRFRIGMLITARRLETLQGSKKWVETIHFAQFWWKIGVEIRHFPDLC